MPAQLFGIAKLLDTAADNVTKDIIDPAIAKEPAAPPISGDSPKQPDPVIKIELPEKLRPIVGEDVDGFVNRYTTLTTEAEQTKKKAEELATTLAQRDEYIKFIDITQSQDYLVNVDAPLKQAEKTLIQLIGSPAKARELLAIQLDKELTDEQKGVKTSTLLTETGRDIRFIDAIGAANDVFRAEQHRKKFTAEWDEYKKQKQETDLVKRQQRLDGQKRLMIQDGLSLAAKATTLLKDTVAKLGLPEDTLTKSRSYWETIYTDSIEGKDIDMEEQAQITILGKLVKDNFPAFEVLVAKAKRLDEIEKSGLKGHGTQHGTIPASPEGKRGVARLLG